MRRFAVLGTVILAAAPATAADVAPGDLLPDLVQERPRDVTLRVVAGRARLGFTSAVHNAGHGPLIVVGRRRTRATPDMRAFQVIVQRDGSTRTLPAPGGLLRYVRSTDHSHWHYRPFERYSLTTDDGTPVARDAKSGFCLGDRYRAGGVRAAAPRPVYVGACGLRRPGRLTVREGISVGWGDDYAGYLEGQSIDVTGVPAGRYRLVHTVNGTGALVEGTTANNTAAVRVELTRRGGVMRLRVLAAGSGEGHRSGGVTELTGDPAIRSAPRLRGR